MTGSTTAVTDEELLARFPGLPIDRDNAFHYRGLLERKLLFQRCRPCGHWIYPASPICPKCWSDDLAVAEVSGKGTVYFFTIVHQGAPVPGVEFPFPVAGVELVEQEALRYLATITDCRNEDIRCGMPVELTWTERMGTPAPVFRPARQEP